MKTSAPNRYERHAAKVRAAKVRRESLLNSRADMAQRHHEMYGPYHREVATAFARLATCDIREAHARK